MKNMFKEHYKHWGLLRDLLFNNIEECNNTIDLIRKTDNNKLNSVLIAIIDNYYSIIYNISEENRHEFRMRVYKSIEKGIKIYNYIPMAIEDNIFAVIIQDDVVDRLENIKNVVNMGLYIKDFVAKDSGISISIGIGCSYEKLTDLYLSYKEAVEAVKSKFYVGPGLVVHFNDIMPYSEFVNFISKENQFNLLMNALTCNLEGARNSLEQLFAIAVAKNINPFLVKLRFIDSFIDIINNSGDSIGNDNYLKEFNTRISEKIFKTDSASELMTQLNEVLEEIVSLISSSRASANRQIFETAVQYIKSNYNKNMTLDEVAAHVYISPYYFSHGFKSFTGMNFMEYLKKVRIEEAKKLLLTSKMSLKNVSKKVGYQDPNYFSRVFKNMVGIPPSDFRISNY